MRLISFYLPQYHDVKENNEWWGEGYTEFVAAKNAQPLFETHLQPRTPTTLGEYDLSDPLSMVAQAELAKAYGIYGFCYYWYWFNGRRMLEKPLEVILENKQIDMPFSLCWANENWTRKWDGKANDVLIRQEHNLQDTWDFFNAILPYLKDDRYIEVNGAKLLMIYRTELIADLKEHIKLLRELAAREGLKLFILRAESFILNNPHDSGLDGAYQFPPLYCENTKLTSKGRVELAGDYKVYDYTYTANWCMAQANKPYKWFRGVMPSWDNTPRVGDKAHLFVHASPQKYQEWLEAAIKHTENEKQGDERLVFINAWNEWGEGAILEPCNVYGNGYLQATKLALQETQFYAA